MLNIKQIYSDTAGPIVFQGPTSLKRNTDFSWDNATNTLKITGKTTDNTTNAFDVKAATGSSYFLLRNDSKMIYRDGNQGAGKIMTSDATGIVTWTSPTSLFTFQNGLTYTSGLVELGGILVKDTTILGANHDLTFGNSGSPLKDVLIQANSSMTFTASGGSQQSYIYGDSSYLVIGIDNSFSNTFEIFNAGQPMSNNGSNNSMIINDAITSKGLLYGGDYSSNFTLESLISKRYADNTYLSTSSIAGGELSGTYPNPTLLNSAVIGKVLTGLNITGSSIVATDSILQAFGKIQNQINGVLGGAIYQGVYNATTNTPTLVDGTGTKGYYYVVNVAGIQNFGSGNIDLNIGDWIIYNGLIWQKVDNTDAVTSVNGYIGAVNLTTADIPEVTNLYYTNARGIGSILTGYVSGAGTITATDTILQAIQKLNGNISTGYVPYIGANANVDTGVFSITAKLFNSTDNVAGFLESTFKNTNASGATFISVYNETSTKSVGLSFFNSTGGVGTLYDNNTGWVSGGADAMGIINEQPTGKIKFATGGFGSGKQYLEVSDTGTAWTFWGRTRTTLTASTENPVYLFNGGAYQFATGLIALQRSTILNSTAYSFVAASTITDAYNLYVTANSAGANATITNNYAAGFAGRVHILEGTSTIKLGQHSAAFPGIWFQQTTPTTTNYNIAADSTDMLFNASSSIQFRSNNTLIASFVNQAVGTTSANLLLLNGQNYTPASLVEHRTFLSNTRIRTWSGSGTIAINREFLFDSVTLASTAALTITNAYSLYVNAPVQGSNVSITNNWAAGFGGNIRVITTNAVGQGILIRSLIGDATKDGIYINKTPTDATTYSIAADNAGNTYLNYPTGSALIIQSNATNTMGTISDGRWSLQTQAVTGGSANKYRFLMGNDLALIASVDAPSVQFTLPTLKQYSQGAITTTREFNISQPTLRFATGSSTVTTAGTFVIGGAVIASTNAIFTSSAALLIESGSALNAVGTVTTGYGALINAPTGATNNYALGLFGNVYLTSNNSAIYGNDSTGTRRQLIDFTSDNIRIIGRVGSTDIYLTPATGGLGLIVKGSNGAVGINNGSPTAFLHIPAGVVGSSGAALKFTQGAILTNPEAGAVEWDGTNLFITQTTGPTRQTIAYISNLTSGYVPYTGANAAVNLNTQILTSGIHNISRLLDAAVTNISIFSGTAATSAFQINTDQPNTTVALDARTGYDILFQGNDTTRMRLYNGGNLNIGVATNTNQRLVRVGQDTAFIDIGSRVTSTASGAIYFNTATPSNTNWSISSDGSGLELQAQAITGSVNIGTGSTVRLQIIGQVSTGASTSFTFTKPNNTNQTLSTEISGFLYNGGTRQWATGPITLQRENRWTSVTYSAVAASVISTAIGNYFEAPTAGTNVTITDNYALGTAGNMVVYPTGATGNLAISGVVTRELVGSVTYGAVYMAAAPAATNYVLVSNGINTFLNAPDPAGSLQLRNANAIITQINATNVIFTPGIATSGASTTFTFTKPANTGQTTNTSIPGWLYNASTRTWTSTATITNQYENIWNAATYNAGAVSTISNAYGNYFYAPIAGTNITITDNFAIGTEGALQVQSASNYSHIFRGLFGTPAQSAYYLGVAAGSETTGNYALLWDTAAIRLNSQTTQTGILLTAGTSTRLSITSTNSGSNVGFLFNNATRTNLTASNEVSFYFFNPATYTWNTGTLATQRNFYIASHTLAFASASTVTTAYGFYAEAATAGTNATITNNYAAGFNAAIQVQTGSMTGQGIVIRDLIGTPAQSAIYMTVTPSSTNYAMRGDSSGNTFINGGQVFLANGGNSRMLIGPSIVQFINATAAVTGAITTYSFSGLTSSNQTASTEIPAWKVNGGSRTWLTGPITIQRENWWTAATYLASAASVITTAYGHYFEAPIASSNITITNNYAAGFDGQIDVQGGIINNTTTSIVQLRALGTGIVTLRGNTSTTSNSWFVGQQLAATNLPASIEATGVLWANNSKQFATGTIATQREFYITPITYTAVAASTITNAYGLYVEAPIASTNMTIINSWAAGFNAKIQAPAIYSASGNIIVGATSGNVIFQAYGNQVGLIGINTANFSPIARTSGSGAIFAFIPPANTNQTASAEVHGFAYAAGTQQWATGNITTQREIYFASRSYSFVGASIITDAYTTYISSPIASTNATITNNWALGVEGNMKLISIGSNKKFSILSTGGIITSIASDGAGSYIGSETNHAFRILINNGVSTPFTISANATTGAINNFIYANNSNTGQTASTEIAGFLYQSYSRQWATGNITTQREQWIKTATYNFIGASVITNAYGLYVEAPTAGTNATITNKFALGLSGSISLINAGDGIFIKEGANATMGGATLVGGTLVINTTKVTATCRIFITGKGNGSNLGSLFEIKASRVNGTSFTVTSTNVLDTQDFDWLIIEQA